MLLNAKSSCKLTLNFANLQLSPRGVNKLLLDKNAAVTLCCMYSTRALSIQAAVG
jgi:hypothetical protein